MLMLLLVVVGAAAQSDAPAWRQANEKELAKLLPARATVESERIETELPTASGVTDGKGKFIAGVVLITAGYSAEGKYAQFFVTNVPIRIGELSLSPGEYVFGHRRIDEDSLEVKFYQAASGKYLGAVKAVRQSKTGPVRSLLITPPGSAKPMIQIGRFGVGYRLDKQE
ncbi:MAG TPA: hypothetical protein VNQ79_12355 [Blastocatellia bacterium]|nr:hypothetical protein [Blastocatellia bacterium]